jgi:hypothetical protein
VRRALGSIALALTLSSCVWLKSVWPVLRDDLIVAVPTALVAVATNGLGSITQFFLVVGTTVAAKGVADVASRDSGETIGSAANDKRLHDLEALVPDLKANAIAAHAKLAAAEGTVSWFHAWWERLKWAGLLIGAYTLIKYLHPRSRAARNFWAGVLTFLRGRFVEAWRLVVSASGWAHTPEKPAP